MTSPTSDGVSARRLTRSAARLFTSSTLTVLLTNPRHVSPTTTFTPGPHWTALQLPTDRNVVQGPEHESDVIILELLLAAILDWVGRPDNLDAYILLSYTG